MNLTKNMIKQLLSIVFLFALIAVIPQFVSAQNATSGNLTTLRPVENQTNATTEATTAIQQPSHVIVPPRVSIFWSQGGTSELSLQYLINDDNIAIQPTDFNLQFYSPSTIEAGDLIEVGIEQRGENTTTFELVDVTLTPLTLDQFGGITETTGNPVPLEEATRDRYALDVDEGVYAFNVNVRLNDVNMVAVYSSPIEVGIQSTT
jgi:hypothetical protein